MKLTNTYSQPASTVSAVLLNNMPEMQARPDRIITLTTPLIQKSETSADADIYQLVTVAESESGKDAYMTVNYEGTKEQIWPVLRHVFYEQMAKQVFENSMGLAQAHKAKELIPEHGFMPHTPLLITTHKIFAPDLGVGLDDFKNNSGPIFSYYEQDWHEGLERAADSATPEEMDDPAYDEIMRHFLSASSNIIHPAFFYAELGFTEVETPRGKEHVKCWNIRGAEPHRIRGYASGLTKAEAGTALSILQKGFIDDRIDADPTLGRLREFNPLHYSNVWVPKKHYMDRSTKSSLMGGLSFQWGLS